MLGEHALSGVGGGGVGGDALDVGADFADDVGHADVVSLARVGHPPPHVDVCGGGGVWGVGGGVGEEEVC